jgi:ABC-type uncharacterized transport system permease subunit
MKKLNKYVFYELLAPVIGFLVSMVILFIIVIIVGESPIKAANAIWKFTFSNITRTSTMTSISAWRGSTSLAA